MLRHHIFVGVLISYMVGTAVVSLWPQAFMMWPWLLLGLLVLALLTYCLEGRARLCGVVLATALFGASWCGFSAMVRLPMLPHLPMEEVVARGVVKSATSGATGQSLTLSAVQIAGQVLGGDVVATVPLYPTLKAGQYVTMRTKLHLPWDNEAQQWRWRERGVVARMYKPTILTQEDGRCTLLCHLGNIRQWSTQELARLYGEPTAGFLQGLLVGGNSTLSSTLQDAFRRSGTVHLVAVSGFNITIVMLFVAQLTQHLPLPRALRFLLQVLAVLTFLVIAGFTASAVRAAIMGIAATGVRLLGRAVTPAVLILCVGSAMVLWNPFLLIYDLSFQLSFGAVLGLVLFARPLTSALYWLPRFYALRETVATTLAAQVIASPLILGSFQTFSVIAIATNALILPLMPWLMLGAAASLVVGHVPGLASVVTVPTALMTKMVLGSIVHTAQPSWASITVPVLLVSKIVVLWCALVACGISFLWWRRRRVPCFSCRSRL